MRRASLADAKTHLSALVNEAEHKGRKTIILRHGKPSAAIVPVDVALSPRAPAGRKGRPRLSPKQIRVLLAGLGKGPRDRNAVADLLGGRR